MEIEDHGWAAFWPNGTPHPFILVHTTRSTRREACECVGVSWAREGETPMQGWRRAYRDGCRVIRVIVRPHGGYVKTTN
jgi:hypothetical protein